MNIEQKDIKEIGYGECKTFCQVEVMMTIEEFREICIEMKWDPVTYVGGNVDDVNEYAFPDTEMMVAWYVDNIAYFFSR